MRVPAGVRFVGRTVNGGIEADELPADAEAYTVNGSVAVDAGGEARAETVNGSIRAPGPGGRTGPAQLQDRQRRDHVELPAASTPTCTPRP